MINKITVQIFSPYKAYTIENIASIYFETYNDSFEIFPEHSDICVNLNFGKISINLSTEISIFNFFQASINFNNQTNQLNIFCLEFKHEKEVLLTLEEIEDSIYVESKSSFHYEFTKDNGIVADKISYE